jgi:hypothetical protein
MIRVMIFLALLGLSSSYAILRGGGPERLAAATLLVGVGASATVGTIRMEGGFLAVPIRLLMIDLFVLAAFIVIAVRANRIWTIPFAACQLLTVMAHLMRLVSPKIIPLSYAFLTVIWSWPMIAVLAYGTWAHMRRRLNGNIIPDWRGS